MPYTRLSFARAACIGLHLALAALATACGAASPQAAPAPSPTRAAAAATATTLSPSPSPIAPAGTEPTAVAPRTLHILADTALGRALPELTAAFARLPNGAPVEATSLLSDRIATVVRAESLLDLVLLEGEAPLNAMVAAGLVEAGRAVPVAEDRLVLVTLATSPIESSDVLADLGLRLAVLGDESTAGAAARQVLQSLSAPPRVQEHPDTMSALVSLVAGQADAALLYGRDTSPEGLELRALPLRGQNSMPRPILAARLRGAPNPELAEAFIALLTSDSGQRTFAAHNLFPVEP